MLMLFAPERTSFLPLDLQQPKSHHSPVCHQYPWDIITTHHSNKYLTWFLQAFNRENRIWDWECWVIRPGGQMGVLEEFQAICLFLFFLFSIWKACTSPYHSVDAAAKTTYALASFPGLRVIFLHLQWLSTFFTPNCPQSKGLGRTQQPCQQLLSFWISVSEMESFRAQNYGYFPWHLFSFAGG